MRAESAKRSKTARERSVQTVRRSPAPPPRGRAEVFPTGAGPIFNAHDTARLLRAPGVNNGGVVSTQSFERLFSIPGESYCSEGVATDQFGALTEMVNWVEKGQAPDTIAAAAAANHPVIPERVRPLCAYPKFASKMGRAIWKVANFVCATQ